MKVLEAGVSYEVSLRQVTNEGISESGSMIIQFCKGSIADESIRRVEGIFVEDLIDVIIHRLESVNVGDLKNEFTDNTLLKLREARMWNNERTADRIRRSVKDTYQK